jgi:hypothetical protein
MSRLVCYSSIDVARVRFKIEQDKRSVCCSGCGEVLVNVKVGMRMDSLQVIVATKAAMLGHLHPDDHSEARAS